MMQIQSEYMPFDGLLGEEVCRGGEGGGRVRRERGGLRYLTCPLALSLAPVFNQFLAFLFHCI